MSLIQDIKEKYRNEGAWSVVTAASTHLLTLCRYHLLDVPMGARYNSQAYEIYDEPWDLLIILDACRYDVMKSVQSEYVFLDEMESKISPASSSREWLQRQFGPEYSAEMKETAYITGNTFSNEIFDREDFALLDEVWKYGWNKETGIVLPRPITDRAISVAREQRPERMIVHYMQPHFPSLESPDLGGQVDPEQNRWINSVWEQLSSGELSRETVWDAYESNLQQVLKEVDLLLTNADFETVVITADHGNCFGEFGIYGHPSDRAHPCLRKVPWIITTAEDTGSHTPREYDRKERDVVVNDQLAALGYL